MRQERSAYVRADADRAWTLGNRSFELEVRIAGGAPTVSRLVQGAQPDVNWGAGAALVPVIAARAADGESLEEGGAGAWREQELRFAGAATETQSHRGARSPALRLEYEAEGLQVQHFLMPAAELPAWRSWTTVTRSGQGPLAGLARFDAANLALAVGPADPEAAYLIGWLFGPRAEAPGRPPVPFPYPSWIPRLLYGDEGAQSLPEAPLEWDSPTLRLVRERLTRLPLRSGRRSTYDNYPWATVRSPDRQAGFFLGFEWSGTWAVDLAHERQERRVSVAVRTSGNAHDLGPGDSLTSPAAFFGLFSGDWDDAFNACRRYVRCEVLPARLPEYPHFSLTPPPVREHRDAASWRAAIDLAAEAGAEMVNLGEISSWGATGAPPGPEFSLGVGDYREDLVRFPEGIKPLCDYARSRGLKVFMGTEFERVDVRAANLGPIPWKPEWLVHQKGYPYRSWDQHVFLICLGVREAAEWALENISRKVEEFGVDWLEFDSNEWAVCDDPTHDHGPEDGEWAQVQGLYHVARGLRERFPDLIIGNCAGGAQRGDFGLARYCTHMYSDDIQYPSTVCRKYSHGLGSLYPTGYVSESLYPYAAEMPPGEMYEPRQPRTRRLDVPPARIERRALSRMMGLLQISYAPHQLDGEQLAAAHRAMAFYRKVRPTLFGDRYVLLEPAVLRAPEHRECGQWEAYQYLAIDGERLSVFWYRGLSPDSACTVRLEGLQPGARYAVEWYSGRTAATCAAEALMETGLECVLERGAGADAAVLHRLQGD